jgi:flagellar hook-length control protein FliK
VVRTDQSSPPQSDSSAAEGLEVKTAGLGAEGAARAPARAGLSAFQQAIAAAGASGRPASSSSGEGTAASLLSGAAQAASHAADAARSGGSVEGQSSAAPAGPAPVVDQIAKGLSSVGAGDARRVTIELNPPELGRVQATFQAGADGVRCRLVVENPQTLDLVQSEKAALLQRLADGGVQVKQVEVSLGQSSSGRSLDSGSGSMQDGSFARQWGQGGYGRASSGGQDWQAGGTAASGTTGGGAAAATASWRPATEAGRINVWV